MNQVTEEMELLEVADKSQIVEYEDESEEEEDEEYIDDGSSEDEETIEQEEADILTCFLLFLFSFSFFVFFSFLFCVVLNIFDYVYLRKTKRTTERMRSPF